VEIYREFRKEVWLSSLLCHPNIVSLKGCCIRPYCCMIMEYLPCGNLKEYLYNQANQISFGFKLKVAMNVAGALNYMHSMNPKIIHRDLKSPNILMVSLNESSDIICKVSDFGESLAVASKASGREKLGNPVWCSPEIMRSQPYTEKTDVFSFGIILWELIARSAPYGEYDIAKSAFMAQFEDEIIRGLRPTIPNHCPPNFSKLIQECWQDDPDCRPNFGTILASLKKI